MRWLSIVGMAAGAAGCSNMVFGSGTLFVWNGTERAIDVEIEGRSSDRFALEPGSGWRLDDAVAGPYRAIERGNGERAHAFELTNGGTAVVNLSSAACFARTDISGMYLAGKERVRTIQGYGQTEVIVLSHQVPVLPGEPLPSVRPRSADATQRLSAVPCGLLGDSRGIAEYVRKSR